MASERAGRWRWQNVPVPEPYVAGLLAGAVFHRVKPWPLGLADRARWALGGTLVAAGLAVVGWAVIAVGRTTIAAPATLVTGGPYRYSRNPMYVGWAGVYAGVTAIAGSAWPLVLAPPVAVATHRTVRREERALERRFGAAYEAYRREVRRYL